MTLTRHEADEIGQAQLAPDVDRDVDEEAGEGEEESQRNKGEAKARVVSEA